MGLEISKKTYEVVRNKYIYADKEIELKKLQHLKNLQEEKEIS
jgi:hypothetical protein